MTDWNEAKDQVDKGKYRAAILFPQDFSELLLDNSTSKNIQMYNYIDATEVQTRAAINSAIFDAFTDAQTSFGITSEFTINEQLANKGTDLDAYDVAIPGIIGYQHFKENETVKIVTVKGELVALGRALESSERIQAMDHGFLIQPTRVIFLRDTS